MTENKTTCASVAKTLAHSWKKIDANQLETPETKSNLDERLKKFNQAAEQLIVANESVKAAGWEAHLVTVKQHETEFTELMSLSKRTLEIIDQSISMKAHGKKKAADKHGAAVRKEPLLLRNTLLHC